MISERSVIKFWWPLSSTWLMMALEGPVLAGIVARLPEPTVNLAAYGVAVAIAILIESPVINILSAVVALARDAQSTRALHTFMLRLNALVSLAMVLVCLPPVYDVIAARILDLPAEVNWRMYGALVCMIPWPAAIGVRRHYQGLLIRAGHTRAVAQGTIVRLVTMSSVGLGLAFLGVEGALAGAGGLCAGVIGEAIATRWMVRRLVEEPPANPAATPEEPLTQRTIVRFYTPLALTSVINFASTPLLAFFVNRMPDPVASLAVIPVINSLVFLFRSFGFSYQEVGIAFLGTDHNVFVLLRRVAAWITLASSLAFVLVAFTPLLGLMYQHVFALSDPLVTLAVAPTQLMLLMPMTAAIYALHRSAMIVNRQTVQVTICMGIEVGTMMLAMLACMEWNGMTGAMAASTAVAIGTILSYLYAWFVAYRLRRGWHGG
jgi:hypothetical protein